MREQLLAWFQQYSTSALFEIECRVHDVKMIKPYRMLMGFIKRSELRAFFNDPDAIELAV